MPSNGETFNEIRQLLDSEAELTIKQRDRLLLAAIHDIRQKLGDMTLQMNDLAKCEDLEKLEKKVLAQDARIDEVERKYNFWSGANSALAMIGSIIAGLVGSSR